MAEEIALKERYTYGNYRMWDDDLRWELIDGEPFCMNPGPATVHQSLSMRLVIKLGSYFEGKECQVFDAPFDVMLPYGNEPENEIDTVVQPDIMILCDKSKLQRNGIKGAPDVVIEILSPATARRDFSDKLWLYERAGVKEYIVADPYNHVMHAYRRGSEGQFSWKKIYGADDVLEFGMFPELKIPLTPLWENILELV